MSERISPERLAELRQWYAEYHDRFRDLGTEHQWATELREKVTDMLSAFAELEERRKADAAEPAERGVFPEDGVPTVHQHTYGYDVVWTVCPECGVDVAVDEEGCCVTCGADAFWHGRMGGERLRPEPQEIADAETWTAVIRETAVQEMELWKAAKFARADVYAERIATRTLEIMVDTVDPQQEGEG